MWRSRWCMVVAAVLLFTSIGSLAAAPRPEHTKPVMPYTVRLGTAAEWSATVHPKDLQPNHRRLVLVAYTSSWCGAACAELRSAYADVAKYFARMKIFSELVIADCVADDVGPALLAADGIRHFPMVVLYGSHLETSTTFQGETSDREQIIDFAKDHLIQLHEFRRDL